MRTPTDIYANELQAQHTIQSKDLLKICQLAEIENVFEKVESFSFEQFFGFACYLFLTTESCDSREQLAAILPNFGSIAVFSLLKISHHLENAETSLEREQHLIMLAQQSLKAIPLPALVTGLSQILEAEKSTHSSHQDAINMLVPELISLTAYHGESILSLLSAQLSTDTWNKVHRQLLHSLSTLRAQEAWNSSTHLVKIRVRNNDLQLANVAC